MRTKLFLFTIGLALALVAAGCSKNSSPTTPPSAIAPAFPSVTLKGPNTNSTDTYAVATKDDVASLNATVSSPYMALLLAVTPVHSGNTWTWTIAEGTFTIAATATTQSDGSNAWVVKMNGTPPGDTVAYDNWTAITGTSSADGKSGNFNTYDPNASTVAGTAVWNTNASGQLVATLSVYSQATLVGKSIVTNNADGSGELDQYEGTPLVYKATWIANGSGTWWTYDANGQTGTGAWT